MKPGFIPLLTIHCLFAAVMAQDPKPIPDKPGSWSYVYLDDENTKMYTRQFGMSPAESVVFRQKLDRIVNVLHLNPVLANPRGIDPTVESRPLYPNGFDKHLQN